MPAPFDRLRARDKAEFYKMMHHLGVAYTSLIGIHISHECAEEARVKVQDILEAIEVSADPPKTKNE